MSRERAVRHLAVHIHGPAPACARGPPRSTLPSAHGNSVLVPPSGAAEVEIVLLPCPCHVIVLPLAPWPPDRNRQRDIDAEGHEDCASCEVRVESARVWQISCGSAFGRFRLRAQLYYGQPVKFFKNKDLST